MEGSSVALFSHSGTDSFWGSPLNGEVRRGENTGAKGSVTSEVPSLSFNPLEPSRDEGCVDSCPDGSDVLPRLLSQSKSSCAAGGCANSDGDSLAVSPRLFNQLKSS